ncbi:hypothetical protein RY831_01915 [Noviherbaspirillum sp. CPCC 100848]|uniref:Uncharacterized protein n=1 Tax=Noviherbaspirillum album TaxID=3080276 RepID=A0ABU6J3D1_9BURK|nr:hypothetical protein [Noviherbaspirillum sp. CPCC 100848]MEC4717895.1 hypothetical protein [Noviherbaspirillum sp. CPCC 100848]
MNQSDEMIELLVSSLASSTSEHDAYLFRDALKRLVRTAQQEQLIDMQRDFDTVYDTMSGKRAR